MQRTRTLMGSKGGREWEERAGTSGEEGNEEVTRKAGGAGFRMGGNVGRRAEGARWRRCVSRAGVHGKRAGVRWTVQEWRAAANEGKGWARGIDGRNGTAGEGVEKDKAYSWRQRRGRSTHAPRASWALPAAGSAGEAVRQRRGQGTAGGGAAVNGGGALGPSALPGEGQGEVGATMNGGGPLGPSALSGEGQGCSGERREGKWGIIGEGQGEVQR
ncbi:hypothetical protein FB451DRAFT_1441308 [Mycena latifolia]|nr:hypothetical protein FB451DRAFT_1441308 [Mycena latifolia]